jgi:uncharacterized protein YdhG (YjbR/CyaY superfamily)
MTSSTATPDTIDAYIAGFPPEVQVVLQQVRATIRAAAPDAVEAITHRIPTFVYGGSLVHFAAFSRHVGLYPAPSGTEDFQAQLAPYKAGKGSVQFPLGQPMPVALIGQIVAFRLQELRDATEAKARVKRSVKKRP